MLRKRIIYLASNSPRRRQILKEMKVPFRVISSLYAEKKIRSKIPETIVIRHALGKACLAETPKSATFVLGSDTIVWHNGKALGKPKNNFEAFKMLKSLSGKKHSVYTALVLLDLKNKIAAVGVAETYVWIKKVSDAWIQNYIQKTNPSDKAGSYAIQASIKIVKKIYGSYSNVVGLPKELLKKMLKDIKYND